MFWMWSSAGRTPREQLHHPQVSEPSSAVPGALRQAHPTPAVLTHQAEPAPWQGHSHPPWNGRSSNEREGALGDCVGGDFKERKVSRRTFKFLLCRGRAGSHLGSGLLYLSKVCYRTGKLPFLQRWSCNRAPVRCKSPSA